MIASSISHTPLEPITTAMMDPTGIPTAAEYAFPKNRTISPMTPRVCSNVFTPALTHADKAVFPVLLCIHRYSIAENQPRNTRGPIAINRLAKFPLTFPTEINGEKQKLMSPGLNVALYTLVSPKTRPIPAHTLDQVRSLPV